MRFKIRSFFLRLAVGLVIAVAANTSPPAHAKGSSNAFAALPKSQQATLDELEKRTFEFFRDSANTANGQVPDHWPQQPEGDYFSSIAAVGFGLTAYGIGVERGWMPRDDAVQCVLSALRFFRDSDQSGAPSACGFKGFYYHFLDIETGTRVWQSELSMVDTALLLAGMLTASQYFDASSSAESELRALVDFLYRRVDWQWAQDGADTIRQGWKPECGFLHYGWEGYSEAILLYALALGSPTHPIGRDCYKNWTLTYQWEN